MLLSTHPSILNSSTVTSGQAHGDAGANINLHRKNSHQINDIQILLGGGSHSPEPHNFLLSPRLPNSQKKAQPHQDSKQTVPKDKDPFGCYGLFSPSFLQGFFVNCSVCRQKNKASAKCYECNSYLCEKCVFAHAKGRTTSFHHIYHFDSLAERLSPTITGALTPPTRSESQPSTSGQLNNNDSGSNSDQSEHSTISNLAMSRVVGAGRRSNGESSRGSSRTSSVNLPSPTESRRSSYEGMASIQTAINSISLSANNISSNGIVNPSYHSDTHSPPTSSLSPGPRKRQMPIGSPARNRDEGSPISNKEPPIAQSEAIDALNEMTSFPLSHFEMGSCAIHQNEFRFFCNDCMVPVCSGCLRDRHMDHSLVYLAEALQKVSQVSHDLNSQIREVNVGLRQALDNLQRMCEGIDYRAHQVSIDVKCTVRRFITALEARQDDILQRLEQARQVKLRLINFQMENVRLYYSKLARALDLINDPASFSNPIENMAANHQAFKELRQAKNLGTNIYPCEDDGLTFVAPNESQLHSIHFMGHLHVSSAPITNSVALCKQPLLYINSGVPAPEFPLPTAKSRPIFGCREIVAIKDFGRMPKLMWGKDGFAPGELCRPWGLTINRFGQMIIADRSNNRIQVFDTEGRYLFHFGTHGSRNGQFDRPAAVAVSPSDDLVVADKDNHRIQVFNRNGEFLFTFGERGSQIGQFMYPWDIACDSMGNILVSDARNHRIQLFRWNGIFIAKWGGELSMPRIFDTPRGVTFDPMGNILMTDFNMHKVVMIERLTGKVRYIGREGKERGQFNRPQGIACDDRGWFVVADSRNYRFQVFNEKGEFMWMVGRQGKEDPAEFDRPCDVTIDLEGHIHLMDFGNDRIQVF